MKPMVAENRAAMKRLPERTTAVALHYKGNSEGAPRIVAKGQGEIAKKIREVAEKAGIPIHRDDDLVELLSQIDIDREIPPELYAAVAEVLSWIYKANMALGKDMHHD